MAFISRTYQGLTPLGSICHRCLRSLNREKASFSKAITTSSKPTASALASQRARKSFGRKYFSANGIFKETLSESISRGGLWNSLFRTATGEVETSAAATLPSKHFRVSDGAIGTPAPTDSSDTPQDIVVTRSRRGHLQNASSKDNAIRPDASSRLSSLSSSLPSNSIRRLLTTYLSLSKPNLTFLIVLTTTASYSLYPVAAALPPSSISTVTSLSTLTLLYLTAGTALSSASANAFNMLLEPQHDAKMSRTRNRPLVRGLISTRGALVFAVAAGIAGVSTLYVGVNPTVAFLGAANVALYAGVYTPLKRISVLNTWVGALVGAIPPLMGWTAAAGQCAGQGADWRELLFGEGSVGGWLLAGLLFAWQFPHFNALSWTIREEYRNAGYQMLAWRNAGMNARVALRYSVLMFPVCFGFAWAGLTGWSFVGTSSVVNGWMCWKAWEFWRKAGAAGSARGLFWASVWHLPIVLVLAMAHKKGLWERILGGFDWPWSRASDDNEDEDEDEDEDFNEWLFEDDDDDDDGDAEDYDDDEGEGVPQVIPIPV